MPASQARTETRLPRAVMRIAADVQARVDARNKPETDPPPNPEAPTPVAAAPTEATPPAPAVPPVDPRESDPLYWKQRFNVTEGMLRRERSDRQTETNALRQQVSELQTSVRTLQAKTPPAEIDLTTAFTPDQIEKYGEEQCRTMLIAAQAAAKAELAPLRAEVDATIKPLTDARDRDQADAAARRIQDFKDELTKIVPTWQAIDVDPAWLNWLAQTDAPTGLSRQEILDRHTTRGNAVETAKVFQAYLKSTTPPTPPMAPHGTAASTPAPSAPAQPTATAGAPTDAEVQDFYKRAALRKVSDKERAEFEARMKLRGRQ